MWKNMDHLTHSDAFSAFRFENFMRTIKRMVRKSEKPLEQVAKQLSERNGILKKTRTISEKFCNCHDSGPLLFYHTETNVKQYKIYNNECFTVDCSSNGDNFYCLKMIQ